MGLKQFAQKYINTTKMVSFILICILTVLLIYLYYFPYNSSEAGNNELSILRQAFTPIADDLIIYEKRLAGSSKVFLTKRRNIYYVIENEGLGPRCRTLYPKILMPNDSFEYKDIYNKISVSISNSSFKVVSKPYTNTNLYIVIGMACFLLIRNVLYVVMKDLKLDN